MGIFTAHRRRRLRARDDDGMDEKRHEGCDGRDHDAPFTNKTHACFVSTCYITRIAGDPRMNVNVR